jgi:hypothetical protein
MLIVSSNNEIAEQRKRIAGIKNGFEKAFERAAKRVATQGRTAISKEIRKHIKIKPGDLNPSIQIGRYKKGASITLKEEERLPLKYFGATQNAKGVNYRIGTAKGKSGKGFIAGAFISPQLGNHVFQRQGGKVKMTKGRFKGKNRQRIYKLMGASAWGAFVVKSMYKPTERDLMQKFNQRLRHEVDYLIAKGAARSG